MQPIEIYKLFLLKLNKNDTNANIKIPKSLFTILFNEQKRIWLDNIAKNNENNDYIEDIEELLELDVLLHKIQTGKIKDDFKLPANFFKRVGSYSITSKEKYTGNIITNWFVKPKDLNVLLQNSNYNPSFEYQETLCILNNDKISVYKTDFEINEVYLSYYREPLDFDIAGYIKLDGTQSKDVLLDLSKQNIEQIVNLVVIEAARNYESPEQVQLALQRLQLNNNN